MTRDKVPEVVRRYRVLLANEGYTVPARMPLGLRSCELSREQRLAHAVHLLDTVTEHATRSDGEGKAGRHLGFLQALLFAEGFYTLEELIAHNRSDEQGW